MATAQTRQGLLTIAGAPRYQHRGVVLAVQPNGGTKMIDPYPQQVCALEMDTWALWIDNIFCDWIKCCRILTCEIMCVNNVLLSLIQTGQYFGAVVCAMNVNQDTYTDLVVISAPMFMDADREGRVYVCSLSGLVNGVLRSHLNKQPVIFSYSRWNCWLLSFCFHQNVDCQSDSPLVLRGDESEYGRFGSSLAVLPDINADGLNDLAVGAPLENDGRGSIYIFHGEGMTGVSLTYSQVRHRTKSEI